MDDVHEEIFETIKSHLVGRGIDQEVVTREADLASDIGLDSLDVVELTLALEERYGIEIPDEDLENVATVRDAIELIQAKSSAGAASGS
ncbi:MAG: acyl carrier protein [Actinomycetota bacterium]